MRSQLHQNFALGILRGPTMEEILSETVQFEHNHVVQVFITTAVGLWY